MSDDLVKLARQTFGACGSADGNRVMEMLRVTGGIMTMCAKEAAPPSIPPQPTGARKTYRNFRKIRS